MDPILDGAMALIEVTLLLIALGLARYRALEQAQEHARGRQVITRRLREIGEMLLAAAFLTGSAVLMPKSDRGLERAAAWMLEMIR